MSRFKEHTGLAFFQSFDQGTVSASPVRVEQVVMFFPGFFYRFANLLVSVSRTRNLGRDSGMRIAVQVDYTGKITRVTYIHSIGNRSNGGTGIVLACLQVLIEDIITVVGGNKTLDG